VAASAGAVLWRDRNFVNFLGVQTLSSVGDSFSFVAIPLLILHTTGSVVQMGVVTALSGASGLISGVFAGVVVDRFDRRRLLQACDLARFVLLGAVPVIWAIHPLVWSLYVLLPAVSAFSMIFQVAYTTVVPSLVDEDQITAANARLYGSYSIAYLVGPALAGLISSRFGPSIAIAVDAVTFLCSAAGVFFVRVRRPAERDAAADAAGVQDDFLSGVRFLWRQPVLRSLTVLLAALTFVEVGLNDVVIFRLGHEMRQSDAAVGAVMSVGIVGTLLASISVSALNKRLGFGPTWVGGWILCGVAVAAIGVAGAVPLVAVLAAAATLGTGVGGISSMSLRQEITPSHLLGRVTAAFWTLHSALGPLGAAVLTRAASTVGVAATLLVAGLVCVVVALAATATPVWRMRRDRRGGVHADPADETVTG